MSFLSKIFSKNNNTLSTTTQKNESPPSKYNDLEKIKQEAKELLGISTDEEYSSTLSFLFYLQSEFPDLKEIITTHKNYCKDVLDISDADIYKKSLNTSIVIWYIRPFMECKGFFKNEKIMNFLKYDFNKEEKKLHSQILELRNKEFAHSDAEKLKILLYKENLDSQTFDKMYDYDDPVSAYHTFSRIRTCQLLEENELEMLLIMVLKIEKNTNKLIDNLSLN